MNTQVELLQADLEMTTAAINVEQEKLHNMIEEILMNSIVRAHDARITRKRIQSGFNEEIEIIFEIGFWNSEENRIDFGSDMWGEYSTRTNEVSLNYGTCGTYSKQDEYQVRRAMLIADFWSKIEEIEKCFAEVVAKADVYLSLENKLYDITFKMDKIKEQDRESEIQAIEQQLSIGDILEYDESIYPRFRLFYAPTDTWCVTKVCDKTIKITCEETKVVRYLNKKHILNLIHSQKIKVIKRGV